MSLKDKLIKAAFGKLQESIGKFKGFLKKPAVLLALKLAAFTLLNKLLDQLKSQIGKNFTDDDALNYVKNNRDLQKLLGEISNDIDESDLNEIVLACENPDYYSQNFNNFLKSLGDKDLAAEDYINIFNNSNEFDNKISNSSKVYQAAYKIAGIAPWLFLAYVVGLKIKDFLNQNENPSPHRGKYIQRLIRSVSSIISQSLKDEKQALGGAKSMFKGGTKERKQAESLLGSFKVMDAVISGTLFASAIYINNRRKLQETALTSFQEITLSQICQPTPNGGDIQIVSQPFVEKIVSCPVDIDDNLVPHIPIEEKLQVISCEVVMDQDTSILEGSQPDIATKALFQNDSSANLQIIVKTGDTLSVDVPMATYLGDKVYPSVNGIVELVEPNKIYVQNISDPDQTFLEKVINQLNDAYKEQNDTKFFISEFYLPSLYPVMLKYSPLIDGSLSIVEALSLFYKVGGVQQRWDTIISSYTKQKKDWNKRNQNISKSDKVKTKAEQERMEDIKTELDQSEQLLFNYLRADGQVGINQAKVTKPNEKEFELIEFYFSLAAQLSAYFDKNTIATNFISLINGFLQDRFFTDKYSVQKIKNKVNVYSKTLSEGTFFAKDPSFYDILRQKWDATNAKIGERFTSGESYLIDLQKNNKNNTDAEKTQLREYILFLFNFSIEIDKLIINKYSPNKTKFTQTEVEGNQIEGFFAGLWKRYDALPGEIVSITKELDNISRTFTTYSIAVINSEQYRVYSIADQSCETPDEEDPYLSPKSKRKFGDLSYWLRYCSFATLASVANPATSWSTGLPPPIGPISFPTVYIPIKAFETNWGFIVVGLTITGIYPFPWALFVNWSTEHHVPLADPTTLLKREIEALKKALTDQLAKFKKDLLKQYLDKAKADIKEIEAKISNLQTQKTTLQTKKPKRDRSVEPKDDIPRYAAALLAWTTDMASLSEQILTAKKDKLALEIKYKIIKDAYDGSSIAQNPDPKIQALQKTQDQIDKQFSKLDSLINNLDNFLAPLPIATKPETANFAFTLKNPKPIIKMASDIDQNTNYPPLNAITDKFEPKNEDLMKTNYDSALSKSFNNFKAYKTALKVAMPTIIQSDPFPKYENLKPSNLPWMTFLLKEWAPTGAKTFGFPGFPPLPVG